MKIIIDPSIKGSTKRVKEELEDIELTIKNYICGSGIYIGIYANKKNIGAAGISTHQVLIAFDRGYTDRNDVHIRAFNNFFSDEHNLCRVHPLNSSDKEGLYGCLTDRAYDYVDKFIDKCVEELITYLLDDVT